MDGRRRDPKPAEPLGHGPREKTCSLSCSGPLENFLNVRVKSHFAEKFCGVVRLARGLYQLPDAPLDANHTLTEAAKCVPKGVVCLVSALALHALTDQLPRAVWMAIGAKDWAPKDGRPPIHIVRFTDALLSDDIIKVQIEGVPVKIFGVAKTIADCFRHRRTVGQSVALEGLQEALRQRKATPAEIARHAERGGVATVMRPYLEALTANG